LKNYQIADVTTKSNFNNYRDGHSLILIFLIVKNIYIFSSRRFALITRKPQMWLSVANDICFRRESQIPGLPSASLSSVGRIHLLAVRLKIYSMVH
jgi:hypothetical protein